MEASLSAAEGLLGPSHLEVSDQRDAMMGGTKHPEYNEEKENPAVHPFSI